MPYMAIFQKVQIIWILESKLKFIVQGEVLWYSKEKWGQVYTHGEPSMHAKEEREKTWTKWDRV